MNIEVHTTKDYEIFQRLKGNREVTNKRVAIIKKSIEQVGYISNPIIVNENKEVIDGQGRLQALIELGMDVEYRVIKGIGINECRAMNLKPTSWTMNDFIESYAEYGNENYVRLKELNDKYKCGYSLLYVVATNTIKSGSGSFETLRSGKFLLSFENAQEIDIILDYLSNFKDIQKRVGGRKDLFYGIMAWIAKLPEVDLNRLNKTIHDNYSTITPPAQTEITLRQISEIYNKGYSKTNRRYFDYEWKVKNHNN